MPHPLSTLLSLLVVFVLLPAVGLAGADLAREGRWANEIRDAIMTGDVTYLKAGEHEFLTLYTEAEAEPANGAVIVLHGIGVHPNWPDVVYPLRTRLPEAGWATLSVQLPILAADARGDEYAPLLPTVVPRLDAALAFLHEQGHQRVAVIGHSLGSLMATYWLSNTQPDGVVGFAGVGITHVQDGNGEGVAAHLARLGVPVLDLYGTDDLPHVIEHASARAASAAQGGVPYQQTVTPAANHFFQGKEDELLATVTDWLARL